VETAPQPAGRSDDTHSRYIKAVGGLILGCLYPPNGNPVPGPKFDYKLRLFERLTGLAHGSLLTPRWRRQSRANPSPANSLLAGNLQGISSIRGSAARKWQQKRAINQNVMSQFPTHPNREFFAALQGI
jgi:hypothetical protein